MKKLKYLKYNSNPHPNMMPSPVRMFEQIKFNLAMNFPRTQKMYIEISSNNNMV